MLKGIVVYRRDHPYEPAFYERLCANYELHPLPIDEPAKSFRRIKKIMDKGEVEANIFVVHRGRCRFFGNFVGNASQQGYAVYHIEENSRLLHCLSEDKIAFEFARGTKCPQISGDGFCDKVCGGDESLCIPYKEWVEKIDLKKVITCSRNEEVFGELSRFLELH